MIHQKIANVNVFILSAVVICFEIISTRISSVIFVQNYAFIILSLAILGLGSGGIFSFYRKRAEGDSTGNRKALSLYTFFSGSALLFFIIAEIIFSISDPYIYFLLLFIPFFFAGIVYAEFFRNYANVGFKIYASDLVGAALGSIFSIFVFDVFNAANAVLFLVLVLFFSSISFLLIDKRKQLSLYVILLSLAVVLVVFGKKDILGKVPIGNFPEKDIYHTYEDPDIKPTIIESRWSINGRSDLVEFNNQNIIKDLFIDGSAGTQMYKFNGNIENHDKKLNDLLLHHSTAIPFLFLSKEQRKNMLVIGPGGGKEVLTGILGEVQNITGVEVNPDFVDIVKQYKDYNGGIYSNFPNVKIKIAEGRHFIKSTNQHYNIIVLALPSTEQLQNIDGIASNENFLLTVEAIKDYLKLLTPDGSLIFTVHNRWELVRLIITSLYAFQENGIYNSDAIKHFMILGSEYAPTIVIKKSQYTIDEVKGIVKIANSLPKDFPNVTYLPYTGNSVNNEVENDLLNEINSGQRTLEDLIKNNSSDISPVRDDSPYFYKTNKGIPDDFKNLLTAVFIIAVLVVAVPLKRLRTKSKKAKTSKQKENIFFPLFIFISIGFGFMILEISLFQKFILFLGAPTIALSILLGSLLAGMGIGSFFGGKIYPDDIIKRLKHISGLIVITGIIVLVFYPMILNELLASSLAIRATLCFVLLLPFGFLLGIPFPTGIQILEQNHLVKYIPWMYGVNGIFTVLGSISAVILSMTLGFTASFFAGLSFYLFIFIYLIYIKGNYTVVRKL